MKDYPAIRLAHVWPAILVCVCCCAAATMAYAIESFEGPDVSWEVAAADVAHRVDLHQRVQGQAHSGRSSERISVVCSDGTYLYIANPIDKCRIVPELKISLWVKSSRPDLQILARVVFPESRDPDSGKPLTTLIRGSMLRNGGVWQPLEIGQVPTLVERQVRVLRTQFGPNIDVSGAYLDLVVLNIYRGSGETDIMIDDLKIAGQVDADQHIRLAAANEEVPKAASRPQHDVKLNGSILTVDGHPFFPRVIEYQGEPLEKLRELGFNAIRVSQVPDARLLAEARQTDFWIISPPPIQPPGLSAPPANPETFDAIYDPILCFSLGHELSVRELDSTIAWRKLIRQADRRCNRPIICGPATQLTSYSRQVDLLSTYRFPLASSLEMTDYGAWLRERPRLARLGTPCWTVIQTQSSAALREQWNSVAGRQVPDSLDPETLRQLAYAAVGAGVRGLEFASHSPLIATDQDSRERAIAVMLTNLEMELIEPWGAGGHFVGQTDTTDPTVTGVQLQNQNSRLLIVTRNGPGTQFVPKRGDGKPVSLTISGVPESHVFLDLTLGGIRPLDRLQVSGGTRITLPDIDTTALILITPGTPDNNVTGKLSKRLEQIAPQAIALQRELAQLTIARIEAISPLLPLQVRDQATTTVALDTARASLQSADKAIAARDNRTAYQSTRVALNALGKVKRTQWERAAHSLGSTVASPLLSSYTTLPEHWRLVERLRGMSPGENRLRAGDFEDLSAMTTAGWRHFQHPQAGLKTLVELAPGGMPGGKTCLQMSVTAQEKTAATALIETPPLWVSSPTVAVKAGELLCIRGRVKVSSPIRGSVDGLMIIDSLGGESLAERFGSTKGWTDFVLYRAVPRDGEFSVTFALTGFGEACLDDVTISPMQTGGGTGPGMRPMVRLPAALSPPRR
ncbi:MAG: hypothetical protein SGJ20_09410 [Planctomycetota bacterium]|nr:hypothetical protein [Planctomycetota bacterium]